MRVLVVHNNYSSRVPSGENLVVNDEVRWLREAGVDVHRHEVSNDEIFGGNRVQHAKQALWAGWSIPAGRDISSAIRRLAPDVVHVHNLFPLLTASAPWSALRAGLPVVWTVHNRQLVCVRGIHFRDGQPCVKCRPGWRLPGIRHACYGGSSAASALVTGATSMFGALARRRVTAIAVSEWISTWLTDTAGFPTERVRVKPNGVAGTEPTIPLPDAATNRVFLFAGQLINYKGIELMLEAWRRADPGDAELRILGDGAMADVVSAAAAADPRIRWLGQVSADEVQDHLREARAVLVPSTLPEACPRSAIEALAYGRPVITTGLGGLSDVVDEQSGWLTGLEVDRVAAVLRTAAESDAEIDTRSRVASARHRELFSPEATTSALRGIYEEAVDPGA